MKYVFNGLLIISLILSCNNISVDFKEGNIDNNTINEVIVLGTIHDGHLTEEPYNLNVLRQLIIEINPDYILAEIPPDRFDIAMNEFLEFDTITESRVKRFPEYVDVIFPLTKTLDFEIIPTAGWTQQMSDARQVKMKQISQDTSRISDWNSFLEAGKKSNSLIKATGKEFDPHWINSNEYDKFVEIELSVYNDLFNDELGLGGWDNINKAHYWYINESLNQHKNEGKRFLITYGAGHKGWFLNELKKRDDIEILYLNNIIIK